MRNIVLAAFCSISVALVFSTQNPTLAQRNPYLDLLGVGNGKCEEVIAWAGILNQEFDARRDNYGNAIYNRSLPLFSDEYFVPTFGKSYAEMNQKDKDKILKGLQGCYSNRKYIGEINALPELRTIQAAFNARADRVWNPENISKDLALYEQEKQEYAAFEDYLNSGDDKIDTEELAKIGQKLGYSPDNRRSRYPNPGAFTFIWPSQLAALAAQLEAKVPVAQANGIRSQIEQISISTANPTAKLAQISTLKRSREFGELKDAQAKATFAAQLAEMENKIIGEQVLAERQALSQIPNTISGFDQLSLWEQGVRRDFGDYYNAPAVQELSMQGSAKREELINQNRSQILTEVQRATNDQSLSLISGRYVSSASNTPVGREILAATQSRKYELDQAKAELAAQAQAKEEAILQEKLMEVTPDGQPTEFQMKTAYEFQIKAGNARLEREKQQAADIYRNQDMKQIMQLFTSLIPDTNVEMKNFSKIACQKAMNMPGYICDFSSVNSTNVQGFNPIQSENEVKTARFVRMDNGVWQYIPLR